MTATLFDADSLADTVAPGGVRLDLVVAQPGRPPFLDGAWWPRGDALMPDVSALVEELLRRGTRITRIAYNPTLWHDAFRRQVADGRMIRLGWFHTMDPHLIVLTGTQGQRVDLLVVPSSTAPEVAARAMAAAADPHNAAPASDVLASASAPR